MFRTSLLPLLGLLVVAGCGDSNPPAPVVVAPEKNAPPIKLEVPKDFPAGFPVYSGAEVTSVVHEGGELSVTFATPDSMDQVARFLREELPKKGWKFKESPAQGGLMFNASKGQTAVSVDLGRGPDRTYLAATASEKPPAVPEGTKE